MRPLRYSINVTLDGCCHHEAGLPPDEESMRYWTAAIERADAQLFGRVTYQMMEGYWPTAAESPEASKHDIEHARWVNRAPKLVFSRGLDNVTWANSRIVRDDIPGEIARLKQQPGKNLLMIGSIATAHTFMQQGLIDEYRFNVNPIALGSGIPLFARLQDKIDLQLVQAKSYDTGVVALHYHKR